MKNSCYYLTKEYNFYKISIQNNFEIILFYLKNIK